MTENIYKPLFAQGARVHIRARQYLDNFQAQWKFHHPLQNNQLAHADQMAIVEKIGVYHGGDILYQLKGISGIWHERCLEPAGQNEPANKTLQAIGDKSPQPSP